MTVTSFYDIIEYTYDANGKLLKEEYKKYRRDNDETMEEAELNYHGQMEYTYSADGKLISAAYKLDVHTKLGMTYYKCREENTKYTFSTDADGRVTQAISIPENTLNWDTKGNETVTPAKEAKITYDLIYGDFYAYEITK